MAALRIDHTAMPWMPPVSFAERQELEVVPSAEEIKAKGLNRPDIRQPEATDLAWMTRDDSRLLGLPVELRMAIYYLVYLMTPVHHAQLAPWYPVPHQTKYVVRAVSGMEKEAEEDGEASMSGLLSSKRPLCGLPTALLRTNREIYHEAREIPFIYNEFVFVNWFSSGVWAARSFTRQLRPWQLSSLRQLRLEILSRDVFSSGYHELSQVFASLSTGLQGLRFKIAQVKSGFELVLLMEKAEKWAQTVSEGRTGEGWVEAGLATMEGLKRLEIEIEGPTCKDEAKVNWCRKLERVLRSRGLETEVVCVEEVGESR